MIEKELLFINTTATQQKDALAVMVDKAKELGYITDEQTYLNAILEREAMIPTSIGFNVAIPHGKTQAVEKPFIAFMKTQQEFVWDKKNGEAVDLIFMIGVPKENSDNLHLKCLSLISKKLMQEEFRDALRNAINKDEAYALLDEINQNM